MPINKPKLLLNLKKYSNLSDIHIQEFDYPGGIDDKLIELFLAASAFRIEQTEYTTEKLKAVESWLSENAVAPTTLEVCPMLYEDNPKADENTFLNFSMPEDYAMTAKFRKAFLVRMFRDEVEPTVFDLYMLIKPRALYQRIIETREYSGYQKLTKYECDGQTGLVKDIITEDRWNIPLLALEHDDTTEDICYDVVANNIEKAFQMYRIPKM
jgi:hypothetical protein